MSKSSPKNSKSVVNIAASRVKSFSHILESRTKLNYLKLWIFFKETPS